MSAIHQVSKAELALNSQDNYGLSDFRIVGQGMDQNSGSMLNKATTPPFKHPQASRLQPPLSIVGLEPSFSIFTHRRSMCMAFSYWELACSGGIRTNPLEFDQVISYNGDGAESVWSWVLGQRNVQLCCEIEMSCSQ
ncbi:hypothetical protein VNO77_33898 [Canavalia gladiata]|uniref:Uncharacterized protein n=1 Tax=Canavalia gladiata TaxID=3824 RepID=A0AAN9KGK3_CANGL